MRTAASVGNRAPPHGGGASGGVLSSASDDDCGLIPSAMREQLKKRCRQGYETTDSDAGTPNLG